MKLIFRGFILLLIGVSSLNSQVVIAQSVQGRFVAFHRFGGFDPQDPVQQLIIQIETRDKRMRSEDKFADGLVVKSVFFPVTGGIGGTVKVLETYQLNHSRLWTLVLRPPAEKEKRFCDFDNYGRVENGNADSNDKGEPTKNFYSTQFDAWLVFPKLSDMRCVIIDSLTDGDVMIKARTTK